MRICTVLYDPQDFGGLEELATTLALGIQQRGHQTSVLSATWVPSYNQYVSRLRENDVPFVQLPKWVSYPASHWPTKEKILATIMWLASPLVYLLGISLFLIRRCSWMQAITSAQNWVSGQLLGRYIGPDWRKPLTRLMLNWWRFRWHPDLIHLHGFQSDTSSLLFVIDWAHTKKLPVIYEEHQTPDSRIACWQGYQQSVNKASMVVAVSEKSAQALRVVCGVTQPIVVTSPLLSDPFASGWQKEKEQLQGNTPVFITTIARLDVAKGLTHLLESIVLIKQTHPMAQFRVYGDGPLRTKLLDYAGQLGLDGSEIFAGAFSKREDLSKIMAQTDIFALSSIIEGQPITIVEAMAYGRPIVATSVGGIPELIQNGVNGLLCAPRDPVCLADKIKTLIEDPDLRVSLGYAARKTYEQGNFQPESVCDHFVSIYSKVLGPTGQALAS